jgi:hypothetical protein
LSAEDIKYEAPRFKDYHLQQGTFSADWLATWRLWLSNSASHRANRSRRGNTALYRGKPSMAACAARAFASSEE